MDTMEIMLDPEFMVLPDSPEPDGIRQGAGIFQYQSSKYKLLQWLHAINHSNDQKYANSVPLKMQERAQVVFREVLDECLNRGIREEGLVRDRRFRTSWGDFFRCAMEGRMLVLCVVDCRGRNAEFESYLLVQQGEIIVPRGILDRLRVRPDDPIIIQYRRLKTGRGP
jgi:hypothetical protein